MKDVDESGRGGRTIILNKVKSIFQESIDYVISLFQGDNATKYAAIVVIIGFVMGFIIALKIVSNSLKWITKKLARIIASYRRAEGNLRSFNKAGIVTAKDFLDLPEGFKHYFGQKWFSFFRVGIALLLPNELQTKYFSGNIIMNTLNHSKMDTETGLKVEVKELTLIPGKLAKVSIKLSNNGTKEIRFHNKDYPDKKLVSNEWIKSNYLILENGMSSLENIIGKEVFNDGMLHPGQAVDLIYIFQSIDRETIRYLKEVSIKIKVKVFSIGEPVAYHFAIAISKNNNGLSESLKTQADKSSFQFFLVCGGFLSFMVPLSFALWFVAHIFFGYGALFYFLMLCCFTGLFYLAINLNAKLAYLIDDDHSEECEYFI